MERYWLYAPGENGAYWDEFYKEGIMAIGWDYLRDLQAYHSQEEIRKKIQEENDDHTRNFTHQSLACWEFREKIKKGDVVFAKEGTQYFLGYGIVCSDYDFDKERQYYKHIRKVEWKRKPVGIMRKIYIEKEELLLKP